MYHYIECRYVFGVTHVPRLEDWPVMPVEHIGFNLVVSSASPQLKYVIFLCGLFK